MAMLDRALRARWLRHIRAAEPQWRVLAEVRGALLHAGALHVSRTGGTFRAVFTYAPQYLVHARRGEAFPLDPINLPLQETPFETTDPYSRLGALFDALPDAWGRAVMAHRTDAATLDEDALLRQGGCHGAGAILFAPRRDDEPAGFPGASDVPRPSALPHEREIFRLYGVARALDAGDVIERWPSALRSDAWNLGGARPKIAVRDDRGDEWILKFPRRGDTYSHQRVEWANLEMARTIGLPVPALSLHDLPDGDCALLVRRFDRSPARSGQPGAPPRRLQFLSAASLISPPADFDARQLDTAYGASIFSYARIADVVRIVSSRVTDDLQDLFARMVLNILVRNTHDHLKNVGFLMDPASPDFRYRLAPLYDVVTQAEARRHQLHVAPVSDVDAAPCDGRVGSLAVARANALRWGLKPAAIAAIVEQVQAVLAERHDYYLEAGMSDTEIAQMDRWIHPEAAPVRAADLDVDANWQAAPAAQRSPG